MIKYLSNETEKEASSPWIPNTPSSRNFGIARASSFSLYEHAILLVTGCCLLVFPDWYLQGVGRLPLLNHSLTKINLWTFTSCHDPIKTYATPFACDVEFPALQLLSLRLESLCTLELLPMIGCHRFSSKAAKAFPGFVCYCMLLIVKRTNGKTLMSCVHRTQLKKWLPQTMWVTGLLQPLDGLLLPAFDIHVAFDLGVRRWCWEREKGQLL